MRGLPFILLLLLLSCHEFVPDNASNDQNVEDITAAAIYINTNYPLLEYKGIDWQDLLLQYTTRAEEAKGDEFYQVLYDFVGELKDSHAKIYTIGGIGVRPYTPERMIRSRGAFDPNLIRKYFDSPLFVTGNNTIEYQYIQGDIGYVRLSTFGDQLLGRETQFENVVNYFQQARGLIVDIRENNGGTSLTYDKVLSHFLEDGIIPGLMVNNQEIIIPATITPHPTTTFTKPVVVIINGTSFSAAEVFADRMRISDHVTLIGDTTAGGGMSTSIDPLFVLPSGKAISINNTAVLRRDTVPIEWNGIVPDILVNQTPEDALSGVDHQLEFAIEFLSN